jgi:hypothetical protein
MLSKSREFGTATLGGLLVGGVISGVLGLTDLSFSTAIGALIGGVFAAYLLHGKAGQAASAGAVSGLLAVPFLIGLEQVLAIFEVVPIPSGPTPALSELQVAIGVIAVMDVVAGAVGGAVFGAAYHPAKEPTLTPIPPSGVVTPSSQVRYCVQCGAQLPSGALMCPHCSARQPQ